MHRMEMTTQPPQPDHEESIAVTVRLKASTLAAIDELRQEFGLPSRGAVDAAQAQRFSASTEALAMVRPYCFSSFVGWLRYFNSTARAGSRL